jgi:N12 class adenine-specific DNA methylase
MNKEQLSDWIYSEIIKTKSINKISSDKFTNAVYAIFGNSLIDFEANKEQLEVFVQNFIKD